MRLLPLIRVTLSCAASPQTYTISTIAGGALPVNIAGTSASLSFSNPEFIAADQAGDVFFGDQNIVMRLGASTGILTLVAGNGTTGFSGDNGPATSAQLYNPIGVAVDSVGNIYIADAANYRVRKVSVSNGVITTVAGNGTPGYSGDNGPATNAQLDYPNSVAVDSAGVIFIAEFDNRIRKVANGVITTVAGNGTAGFSGDNGPATAAQLSLLFGGGLAVDPTGNLYIADASNERIRKVSNGIITTVAGNGVQGFSGDNGAATSAEFSVPTAVAVDAADNLYISDFSNSRIRKVSNGVITTVAGKGGIGFGGDNGPAAGAQLSGPTGIALDSSGNLYIVDFENGRIRKVSNGVITTAAGNGSQSFSGDNGPPTSAQLSGPTGLAVDSAGSLYITDTGNDRIRKISNGVITTVAGNGTQGFGGDNGSATNASLREPEGVAVDSVGNLYIADSSNSRVRRVSSGLITTVAGNGTYGFSGDNSLATNADLNLPNDVAADLAGNLYIADRLNNRIRKVQNGVITTVAGGGTQFGDNGPAIGAQLNDPSAIALDAAGNIYIADTSNNRIRKVSGGIVTTVAGNGNQGFSGDNGPSTSAQLSAPAGVAVDSAGNLYIADTGNSRIRRVENGVITTVAGGGTQAGGNGPATSAQLGLLFGVAVDAAGNIYVSDVENSRIQLLTPSASLLINAGGVVNAASSAAGSPVAPGSIATVFGSFPINSLFTASIAPLPFALAGLSLQFGAGLSAPLFAVSGGQVNFEVPWELAGQSQTAISASINGETSPAQTINLAPYAPGLFSTNSQGSGPGAILDSSYNLVSSSNPATAGVTIIQIYCTGLGPVTNQPPSGSPPLTNQLSQTTATPTVTIGGAQAQVLFSGLAPGSVGEYQVDAIVPAASSKGAAVPVVLAIGGATSNTVTIPVQ
jgi:uncharacterized protein (TIGR03437 family)